MRIYVSHSKSFDFKNELYKPIRESSLNEKYTFILPHENSDKPFSHKDYLKNEINLIIAEVSYPATGMGIELGQANVYKIPIICIYKKNSKISGSLKVISKNFIEYSNSKELISGIKEAINHIKI